MVFRKEWRIACRRILLNTQEHSFGLVCTTGYQVKKITENYHFSPVISVCMSYHSNDLVSIVFHGYLSSKISQEALYFFLEDLGSASTLWNLKTWNKESKESLGVSILENLNRRNIKKKQTLLKRKELKRDIRD